MAVVVVWLHHISKFPFIQAVAVFCVVHCNDTSCCLFGSIYNLHSRNQAGQPFQDPSRYISRALAI